MNTKGDVLKLGNCKDHRYRFLTVWPPLLRLIPLVINGSADCLLYSYGFGGFLDPFMILQEDLLTNHLLCNVHLPQPG
jgi:hypothetical protein